jgi:hypothetical protein
MRGIRWTDIWHRRRPPTANREEDGSGQQTLRATHQNPGKQEQSLACARCEGVDRPEGYKKMCDYSLQNVSSRPATVGDQLVTRDFRTGTRGFADVEAPSVAVCLMPGTEIAFPEGLLVVRRSWFGWQRKPVCYQTAIFRQVNKNVLNVHHDALEFPDGRVMLLTTLAANQKATVLQLPARPRTPAEAEVQRRAAYAG